MSLGFLDSIKNSAIAFAASTSYAKSNYIRPELEALLTATDTELMKGKAALAKIESLKAVPALQSTLNDLTKTAEAVLSDFRTNATLDTLADIIGNHVGDFESVDAFKKAFPAMKSVKKLMNFGKSLIDLENYKKLITLLTELQDFSALQTTKQNALLKSLEDKSLVTAITLENDKLNIDQIHKDVKVMVAALCKELKLSDIESKALSKLLDTLTDKHLSMLNTIRHALVEQLPIFLAKEKERLCKLHPELVVHEEKKSVNILDRFKRKVQDAKTAPRGKQASHTKEEKAEAEAEAEVEAKPSGKHVPKKLKANNHK